MTPRVLIASSPQAWLEEPAKIIFHAADQAIRQRRRFSFVLSGGSTPRSLYQTLALPENVSKIDWLKTNVFWGDERVVPPDHPDSNYRMAKEALLDAVPLPPENIFRIKGELPPQDSAEEYQDLIETYFGDQEKRFDLILLGLGEDGHTASLFPGSPGLQENQLWAVPNYAPNLQAWRITMTYPALLSARQIIFLVGGENKAAVIQQIFQAPLAMERFPAAKISANHPNLTWVLDQAAASLL